MSSPLYLCYDLKGIQSFVFAVPRVRYICGGSALIDRFDREIVPQLHVNGVQHLFSGGGKGAFTCTDAHAAQQLQNLLVRAAHEDGMTICFGCDTDYSEAAHVADQTFPFLPAADDMNGHPCKESGLYPADVGKVHPIIAKRVFQKGERLDRHFERELQISDKHVFFHDVDASSKDGACAAAALGSRNRWAVIVMDGNDMGLQHREAAKENDGTKFTTWLRRMSTELDVCCRESCRKAIRQVVEKWTGDNNTEFAGATMDDGTTVLPIRPLLVGGDDIIVLCHVRYAMDFVKTACKTFEDLSAEKATLAKKDGITLWPATGGKITLTAGVLFAPVSLPLASAMTYAELLLASAKSKGRKHTHGQPAPACVDWESVTEGLIDTPAARRQRELIFDDQDIQEYIVLTKRPYTLADFDALLTRVERYTDIPSTIRHQVLTGLRAGFWDRKVFVARLGKRNNHLVADLDEDLDIKNTRGRWAPTVFKVGTIEKKARDTDVIDALLLLEEDARMNWHTT